MNAKWKIINLHRNNIIYTCKPAAPGSTPESNIPITTPLPSYSGNLLMKAETPVSFFGKRAQTGNSESVLILKA